MICRLAAAVLAGALVLVPPAGAGPDAEHVSERPVLSGERSVAARDSVESTAAQRTGTTRAGAERSGTVRAAAARSRRAGDFKTHGMTSTTHHGAASESDAIPPEKVAAFGFGAKTGFFPSDEPRELVLSFDDGPDLKFTPLVLDELDRRGIKAIFFVTGHRVVGDRPEDVARRELLGRIAAHGHMVANHTMTHRNLCQAGNEVAAEIDDNAEVIAQATGLRPLLFRAPYGARCRTLEAELVARQLVSVGWNLDPQDWKNPTSDGILEYLQLRLSRLKGRGILLLHDTHPDSVFALGPLLDWIARENRVAVRDGRPPIVLRDYSVFLPPRPVPRTGIATVIEALAGTVMASVTPRIGLPSPPARR